MQWVGEEPAGCAGFLLSHKGGGDAHQQPEPPLEALAVLGTPYMTHGGLTWGLYKTFGHISGGSVSAPGLSRAHPQHRGAAGCVDPCISLLLPVSPWRRGCVCGAGLTGSLLEELQQRGWVSLAALRSDVGAAGRNSEFLRGHSCHSCAGPCPLPAPPSPEAVTESHFHGTFPGPYSFSHARAGSKPPLPAPEPLSRAFSQRLYFSRMCRTEPHGFLEGSWEAGGMHRLVLEHRFPTSKSIQVFVSSPLLMLFNC